MNDRGLADSQRAQMTCPCSTNHRLEADGHDHLILQATRALTLLNRVAQPYPFLPAASDAHDLAPFKKSALQAPWASPKRNKYRWRWRKGK